MVLPDWIFFDCFNTLIDDFDENGDISGLGPIRHLPVEAGFYASSEDFIGDYTAWRNRQWPGGEHREIPLPERFRAILIDRAPFRMKEVEPLVQSLLHQFKARYPATLRPTPGVREMLDAWSGRVRMGVVSNFFLSDWPATLLTDHGLSVYFDFVLDSSAFGWKKPDPRIYREALRLSGLSADQAGKVLFIGDNPDHDVRAPLELGMRALYLDRSAERPSPPPPAGIDAIVHWDQFRTD